MSIWDIFTKGANEGFDQSINLIKGEKTVPDAMKDIKDNLSKNGNKK